MAYKARYNLFSAKSFVFFTLFNEFFRLKEFDFIIEQDIIDLVALKALSFHGNYFCINILCFNNSWKYWRSNFPRAFFIEWYQFILYMLLIYFKVFPTIKGKELYVGNCYWTIYHWKENNGPIFWKKNGNCTNNL